MLDKLERRMGGISFPGFLRYYALMHALVYVLQLVRPDIGLLLEFDRAAILGGEVWRVVTFLFASSGFQGMGLLGAVFFYFMVRIAFMMSDALEEEWGAFSTSLFFYAGVIGLIAGNFLLNGPMMGSGFLLYGAAFFAFATLFPDVEFLMFFILPVKVKYLAWIQAFFLLVGILASPLMLVFFALAYANYVCWAGIPLIRGRAKLAESAYKRKQFRKAQEPVGESFHKCAECGRTDVSDPELEFRVGKDGKEYCDEHQPE
ncbi:MAG: hypothetical protein Q7R22_012660 [Verrucomicrobiota bacterium JB025]|nr:hypothetical protein [Verrucomicrobiota bacterium JB025]